MSQDNPTDKELWQRVARTVKPLRQGSSRPDIESFEHLMRINVPQRQSKTTREKPLYIRADKKTRRGKVEVTAKIDLHDMTAAQAFPALRRAIIRAYNRNHACLLVVTGKGLRGQGVLRRSLPEWLQHPEIRPVISEFAPAHLRHGGSGAWYVFLKTSKTKS